MTPDRTLAILLGMSVIALGLGGIGVVVEARPFLSERGDLAAVAHDIVAEPLISPLTSVLGLDRFARNCNRVISAGPGVDLDRTLAAEATDACEIRLRDGTRRIPGWSHGWMVLAKVAERRGDMVALTSFLARSQQAAPGQYWLAANRFIVAMRQAGSLPPDQGYDIDADIGLLASSGPGAALLADYYVDRPGFRDQVVGVVLALDPATRQRFLDRVRTALARRPGS